MWLHNMRLYKYWCVFLDFTFFSRALHFLQTFFSYVLEDTKAVNPRTDLVPFIKSSYEKCLKMYHGWMAQQVFAVSNF